MQNALMKRLASRPTPSSVLDCPSVHPKTCGHPRRSATGMIASKTQTLTIVSICSERVDGSPLLVSAIGVLLLRADD